MTKKYIKRQLVLNSLNIPVDEDIISSYEFFLTLFDIGNHYEYRGKIYYKKVNSTNSIFIYKKNKKSFTINRNIWANFIENDLIDYSIQNRLSMVISFLEYYLGKETDGLNYF